MPESPRWLIIKERDDEAKKVLQKIRATDDIEDEYESIRSSCMEAHKEDVEKSRSYLNQSQGPTLTFAATRLVGQVRFNFHWPH